VANAAIAAGLYASQVLGARSAVTTLWAGVTAAVCAGGLWLARRLELLMLALFAGLLVTVSGFVLTIEGHGAPTLAFALSLWGVGLSWSILGWQYPEAFWTSFPLGSALALIAPSIAVSGHGWVYAIGIGTAAGAMAASVPLRNIVLLAFGTVGLFGYMTAIVFQYFYFRDALGLPATLTIAGALLLALALVTARLRRATGLTEQEAEEERLAELEEAAHEAAHPHLPKAA
jgi:hypothetical protein